MPRAAAITPFVAGAEIHIPVGVSAVRTRYRERAMELVAAERLGRHSKMSFRIVPLDFPATDSGELWVKGEMLYAPRLLPESGKLTALAFGVGTLGAEFEHRISTLFGERKASLAVALDSLANELLMDVSRRPQDRILAAAQKQGLDVSGELHAGDPGLDLSAQGLVLRMAEAHSVGVHVSAGLLLNPLKSTSVVFGVGENLPAATWSRCDECRSRPKCGFAKRRELEALEKLAMNAGIAR